MFIPHRHDRRLNPRNKNIIYTFPEALQHQGSHKSSGASIIIQPYPPIKHLRSYLPKEPQVVEAHAINYMFLSAVVVYTNPCAKPKPRQTYPPKCRLSFLSSISKISDPWQVPLHCHQRYLWNLMLWMSDSTYHKHKNTRPPNRTV